MASLSPDVKQAINYTADRASERAVKRTLLSVGIDASSGEGMQEAQRDMALLRRIRIASETRSVKVYVVVVAAGLSVFNSLLVLGVQYLMTQGG